MMRDIIIDVADNAMALLEPMSVIEGVLDDTATAVVATR